MHVYVVDNMGAPLQWPGLALHTRNDRIGSAVRSVCQARVATAQATAVSGDALRSSWMHAHCVSDRTLLSPGVVVLLLATPRRHDLKRQSILHAARLCERPLPLIVDTETG